MSLSTQLPPSMEESANVTPELTASVPSGWRQLWRRFRRHKLAMAGLVMTILIYLVAVSADFLSPYATDDLNADFAYAPPQLLRLVHTDAAGDTHWGPFVYGFTVSQDPNSLQLTYEPDRSNVIPLAFFVEGAPYRLFGLLPMTTHLLGRAEADSDPVFLLGADRNGYDLLSRLIHGTRVSMSIGLFGVTIAFVLGVLLGGVSGYAGGVVDSMIQRLIEFIVAIPTLPLWLGLAAAMPRTWSSTQKYFAITVILSLVAWTELARVVRGRFMSLREEEFVVAARLDGARQPRIIYRHVLPSMTSHLLVSLTLSIPAMILAETALSFLGLGLQPPVISWGVLLQQGQSVRALSSAPWLLAPGVAVVVAVLSLNFLGDGLRDAADPYRH